MLRAHKNYCLWEEGVSTSEEPENGTEQCSEHVAEQFGFPLFWESKSAFPSTTGWCSHSLFPRMESRRFAPIQWWVWSVLFLVEKSSFLPCLAKTDSHLSFSIFIPNLHPIWAVRQIGMSKKVQATVLFNPLLRAFAWAGRIPGFGILAWAVVEMLDNSFPRLSLLAWSH